MTEIDESSYEKERLVRRTVLVSKTVQIRIAYFIDKTDMKQQVQVHKGRRRGLTTIGTYMKNILETSLKYTTATICYGFDKSEFAAIKECIGKFGAISPKIIKINKVKYLLMYFNNELMSEICYRLYTHQRWKKTWVKACR
ncbi:hypothetical protein RhiirC2_792414 [Rhizophagus irregularis]|uniref:Uncharacterized protein n=1 Tax=Rhizophagus irregularis TaxID=588596 RepID=A0A2N1MHC3_9GLOM|nr:hypothetical protein RhiirC2_792414 [Rhizophagus irregularis]